MDYLFNEQTKVAVNSDTFVQIMFWIDRVARIQSNTTIKTKHISN